MLQNYSIITNTNNALESSFNKKNKEYISLNKKQKSHNSLSYNKTKIHTNKFIDINFLSLKNKINLENSTREVSRKGFKKLISSFLIKSGKSKKLESKIYSSYTFFSKKYPEYWLDKHIELFFTKYAFPLIYTEKYRIFRKRRSKKAHFARQSLNTSAEQKYIFNFFKEFLSKKLTRNFKKTFQYHFLTLTSNRLGLTSIQKTRTKENILKWNRFSKAARSFRNEKRRLAFLNKKSSKNTMDKKTIKNIQRMPLLKNITLSQNFLLNNFSEKRLGNKRRLYPVHAKKAYLKAKPRNVFWSMAKNLKNKQTDLNWAINHQGIFYKFFLTNSFFLSYKKHLLSSLYREKLNLKLIDKKININRLNKINILDDTSLSLGNFLSKIRVGESSIYHLDFYSRNLIKNRKIWEGYTNFSSKTQKTFKKKINKEVSQVFGLMNKSFLTLKFIHEKAKWNKKINFNSLRIINSLENTFNNQKNFLEANKKQSFKFMKQSLPEKKLNNFNLNKVFLYKEFYTRQKIFYSFKSNRYNFIYSNKIAKESQSTGVTKNFKLNNFLRNSNSHLILNLKKGLSSKKTFPWIKEKQNFLSNLRSKNVINYHKRQRSLFTQKTSKFEKITFSKVVKWKVQKFEKDFKSSLHQDKRLSQFRFKLKNLFLTNSLTSSGYSILLNKNTDNNIFPIMFKLNGQTKIIVSIESYSQEIIKKIKSSFDNLATKSFNTKDISVKYSSGNKKIKRLAILTSPHVNKIAQQHFEKVSYKEFIHIKLHSKNLSGSNSLIKWVKILNNSSYMSKVSIKIIYD